MFERFTREARAAVQAAVAEAGSSGARQVRCLDLVAGAAPLVRGPFDLDVAAMRATGDAEALATLGIDLEEVRRRVEAAFGAGALESTRGRRGHTPFAPGAKKALELALREAVHDGARRIEAEHVVLGALRADDPALTVALRRAGADTGALREQLRAALAAGR